MEEREVQTTTDSDLLEADDEELAMMTKIVDKMTTALDLGVYHDG
jgi:non-homologous end joining protein Ku